MAEAFKKSQASAVLKADIAAYKARHERDDHEAAFRQGVEASTHPLAGRRNAYRKDFFQQIVALVVRQWLLTLADRRTLVSKIVSNLLQSTLVGAIRACPLPPAARVGWRTDMIWTLFRAVYKPAKDASGAYAIARGLFFVDIYFVILSVSPPAYVPLSCDSRRIEI